MIVPILLGSGSDQFWAGAMESSLKKWEIPSKIHIVSAHKVPENLIQIIEHYNNFDGQVCYITVAGRSNGLSGCTAGSSIHPVIACPPFKDQTDMMVNLNSTLQMPSDTPVMTILDRENVVMAIIRIFSLNNPSLREKYKEYIRQMKSKFEVEF